MNVIETYESFHDWYLLGVLADMDRNLVELQLVFDNKQDRARLIFTGASRCLINEFLIQNIIYSLEVLDDFESPDYARALDALDQSYPWGKDQPRKNIASIQASLGAEAYIEFDHVTVAPNPP